MKHYLPLFLLLPTLAVADYLAVETDQDDGFVGPTTADVELMAVDETSPYGSSHPLSARVRNNSEFYLDRVAIDCTLTDERGFRVFRDIRFRSGPAFSVRIALPPISMPEQGVPPGGEAEFGLYTKDNRWIRGEGRYRYDCDISAVAGRD